MEKRAVNPWAWSQGFGFNQAMEVSGASSTLVCSGQTSVDADGNALHAGDMAAQAKQALANVETVLKAGGMDWTNVVKLNYYTTDVPALMGAFGDVGSILGEAGCSPASTLLGVAALFHPDIMIEIEVTAMK